MNQKKTRKNTLKETPKKRFLPFRIKRAVGPFYYGLGFIGLILAGLLIQNLVFGRIFIAIYGTAALIFRVDSEDTLTMTLICFACTIIGILTRNSQLAQNFAEYAYELLFFGLIGAVIEHKRHQKA